MYDLAVLLAPGFEEGEMTAVAGLARRAGLKVQLISVVEEVVESAHGMKFVADTTLASANSQDCRALFLPGGVGGAEFLRDDQASQNFIRAVWEQGGYVAAVCAAPIALAAAGLTQGRCGTCYPGFESGCGFSENRPELVVRHGKLVTSKGPATAQYLGLTLVSLLAGEETRRMVYDQTLYPLVKDRSMKHQFVYECE